MSACDSYFSGEVAGARTPENGQKKTRYPFE